MTEWCQELWSCYIATCMMVMFEDNSQLCQAWVLLFDLVVEFVASPIGMMLIHNTKVTTTKNVLSSCLHGIRVV